MQLLVKQIMFFIIYQISSSFDTMDPFGTGQVLPPLQVPQPSVQETIIPPLKKPPKWVRRPVGASFGVSVILEYFMLCLVGLGLI